MRNPFLGCWHILVLFFALPAAALAEVDTSLPTCAGLPVVVRTAMHFGRVTSVDEKEGTFTATVDLRLRWPDTRLEYPKPDAAAFKEFKEADAAQQLTQMWVPLVELANTATKPTVVINSVRIFPDGQVEWIQRLNAKFTMSFDPQRFPFDQQKLGVEMIVRGEDRNRVTLDYRQDDLDFSAADPGLKLERWHVGLTNIRREPLRGLYGASHARAWVELQIQRKFTMALAPIFIPLFASLLIPLMAVFMNRTVDGVFQIEAFSLANIVIGGLFAVIALNFTVNASYPTLGGTDNTVTRLFGLSYLAQGSALAVIIALFRFNAVRVTLGKYVQEQLFLCLVWAGPLLAFATALAVLFVALA
jgi:hypothetical protein